MATVQRTRPRGGGAAQGQARERVEPCWDRPARLAEYDSSTISIITSLRVAKALGAQAREERFKHAHTPRGGSKRAGHGMEPYIPARRSGPKDELEVLPLPRAFLRASRSSLSCRLW